MISRTQYSAINAISGAASQVFIILLNFVSRSVFVHFLSIDYLGIQGLFTNILTVLSFAELGIGEAMVYALYKPMKDKNHIKLAQLMKVYQKAYRYVACIVLVLGGFFSFFLSWFVGDATHISDNLQLIFFLFVLNTALSYLFSYKKSILLVDQKRFITTISHQLFVVIQIVLQIAVLYLTQNYIGFLVIQVLCTLGDNCLVTWYVNRNYPYLSIKTNDLPSEEWKQILDNIKALALTRISGVASNGSTNIIISKILGLAAVGVVSNYLLIVNAVNGILWTGLTGITGSLGNLNVHASIVKRREIFDQMMLISFWIYSCCCICLFVLINPFIELWLGKDFLISDIIVFAIIWQIYIGGVNYPAFAFRTTLGYFVQVKYAFFSGAILTVVLSIIGGIYFGLTGILFGVPIARLLTSEVADGYYVFKYGLQRSPLVYLKKYVLLFILFLICCGITDFCIKSIFVDGIIGFIVKILVSLAVTNVVMYLSLCRTKAFCDLLKRAKNLVHRA